MQIKKKEFIKYGILLVLIVGSFFVDWRISTGLILGTLFSILHYKTVEFRYNNLGLSNKKIIYIGAFFSIFILFIPLLISFLIPSIFSWIGTAIGLLYNKYYLFITNFIKR